MAEDSFDLIIVGGGVYGATLALESATRGLRPLLLERDDFGGATSWNSLRFIHSGFRYLQSFDVRRLRESAGERRWYLRHFPDLVQPVPVRLPLYDRGLRRPPVLMAAAIVNDLLTLDRNRGVEMPSRIPAMRVEAAAATRRAAPALSESPVAGSVVWHDGVMVESARVLIEIVRWATAAGARCLNYTEGVELLQHDGQIQGVCARDLEAGRESEFRAPVLVNCAGPWSAALAKTWGEPHADLFRPSLALNLHLDVSAPAEGALALPSARADGGVYVLRAWHGGTLVGTYHAPWDPASGPPVIDGPEIGGFLEDLNVVLPQLSVDASDIRAVLWGRLPVVREGGTQLRVRDLVHDHGRTGGLRGMYSVSGVKFTTARRVAKRTLRAIYASRPGALPARREVPRPARNLWPSEYVPGAALAPVAQAEAALHLDDVMLRRTDWWVRVREDPGLPDRVAATMAWDDARLADERRRFDTALRQINGRG